MDELIREVERNIRNSKAILKAVENRVAYQKNDLATERVTKAQLEFYEGVHKELEYAKSHHELEEQLGCPLDVIVRAVRDGIYGCHKIYDGARTEAIEVFEHFEVSFDGYSLWNETNYEYNYDEIFKVSPILNEINLYDYKKTWWLKEDKSE